MPAEDLLPVDQAEKPLYLGIDVGGTSIKFGLVDNQGRTLARTSIPTESDKPAEKAVRRMAAAYQEFLSDLELESGDIAAVGLGTPGTMDIPAGMLLTPPNLAGWGNFPIRDALGEALDKKVTFANDAAAAAFGEWWVGSGRNYNSIILLTLGTGVGGGIIIGDLSIDGENSHGAEVGHIIIDYHDTARRCACGGLGHLEAYASATGVIKRTEEALAAGAKSSLTEKLASGKELTPLLVARAAEAGDEFAHAMIMETAMYLGVGVVTLMHTIDPGAVILGGAMNFGGPKKELGRQFLDRVRQEVKQRAFPTLVKNTVIDYAVLAGDAGYIGAAGLARVQHQRKSP